MYGTAGNTAVQGGIPVPQTRPPDCPSVQTRLIDVLVRLQSMEDGVDAFYHRLVGDGEVKQAPGAPPNPQALTTIAEHIDQTVQRINNTLQNIVAVIGQ